MKKLKNWIIFQYNSIWNTLHWNRMKFKAHFKKWCSKNKFEVFFIVPATKKSLCVISQNQRRDYNKIALKQGLKKLTHNELIKACYYCTGQIITLK
jgi:hypothetical protein